MSAQIIILQIIKEASLIDQRMNDQFIGRVQVLAQSNPRWTSLERDFFPTSQCQRVFLVNCWLDYYSLFHRSAYE